jgi:hypothetical protein
MSLRCDRKFEDPCGTGERPDCSGGSDDDPGGNRGPGGRIGRDPGAAPGGFAARANLTVPLRTVLGLADRPGALPGFGPIDPDPGANTLDRDQNGHQATPDVERDTLT